MSPTQSVPVIDADSHLTEPRDLFTSRISSKWGDLVPHVRLTPEQIDGAWEEDSWYIGDKKIAPAWSSAAVGHEFEWPNYPKTEDGVIREAMDAAARVAYLDSVGVAAQVLYPNVAGFGGQRFLDLNEPELQLLCIRAYNDFLLEWVSYAPERFIPVAALPFWNIPEAVQEIERVAPLGMKGILFAGAPHELGQKYLADRHWDPIWAAAQAHDLPVSFHLGSGDMRKSMRRAGIESRSGSLCRVPTDLFMGLGSQLNDLLFCGVLPRFPNLKFIMVESCVGQIPFILESADYHFSRSNLRKEWDFYQLKPSEYFARQVYGTFWFEDVDDRIIEQIGVHNVMFETDFPHPTSLRSNEVTDAVGRIERSLKPETARRVLHDNAAELYRLPVSASAPS
jgi:uncharacterized protein